MRGEGSRETDRGAGWDNPSLGSYRDLISDLPGSSSFLWLLPKVLWESRNDKLTALRDPIHDYRRKWMKRRRDEGATGDDCILFRPDLNAFSFLLVGDTGEGDHSQYALVPGLESRSEDAAFVFICSDVIYPAGRVEEYGRKFHHPYKGLKPPIYAIPGNHDWYDELQGFMYQFCGTPPKRPTGGKSLRTWLDPREYLRLALWRSYRAPADLAEVLPKKPIPSPGQPGPYFAIDTPHLRIVGIDTGIRNSIDRDQAAWLERVSEGTKPKLLLTGKPLCVDGKLKEGEIEGRRKGEPFGTVHDVFAHAAYNYVATIGGDIHNYQHYPVRREDDGRLVHYVVSGGGGAFTQATFDLRSMEEGIPGVGRLEYGGKHGEDAFKCYPLRGDSLAMYSRLWDQRFFGLGAREIEPAIASLVIKEKLKMEDNLEIEVTRNREAAAVKKEEHFDEKMRRARESYERVTRVPWLLGAGPILTHFYSEFFDWDRPPFFKHFLRIEVDDRELRIRCLAATGWRDAEKDPPVEDKFTIPLENPGSL